MLPILSGQNGNSGGYWKTFPEEEQMNWPMTFAALVLAFAPVVAQSQRPVTDDLKGRAITIRACVEHGIANAVLLKKFTDVTAGENAAAPVRAKRTVYWFYKPADIKDRTGQMIEVSASVAEATEGDLPLTAYDVVGELEAAPTSPPVANASNVTPEKADGTSGSSDVPETITLKLEVSRIRQLSGVCR